MDDQTTTVDPATQKHIELSRADEKIDLPPENGAPEAPKPRRRVVKALGEKIETIDSNCPPKKIIVGEGQEAAGIAKAHDYVETPEAVVEQAKQALEAQLADAQKKGLAGYEVHIAQLDRANRIQKALKALNGEEAVVTSTGSGNTWVRASEAPSWPDPKMEKRTRRKASKPAAFKGNPKLMVLLKSGWKTMPALQKATGWKKTSLATQLSNLKAKRQGPRGEREYRL